MTELKMTLPSVGESVVTADPDVTAALEAIKTWTAGQIDSTNIKAEGVTEAALTKALVEKLVTNVGLVYATSAISLEGASGKYYNMTANGTTLTLPTPTANRMIGGNAGGTATLIKVTASSGKIYHGSQPAGATTVEYPFGEAFLLFANGSDWLILSGEPKREQVYVQKTWNKAEAEAGVEPSATRPAFVSFVGAVAGKELQITVGGVGDVTRCGEETAGSAFIPPGQKWKAVNGLSTRTILL